jgi:hypothetical protein
MKKNNKELSWQLYALGFVDEPKRINLDTVVCRSLEALYDEHGDTLGEFGLFYLFIFNNYQFILSASIRRQPTCSFHQDLQEDVCIPGFTLEIIILI